ncbi:MAG: bifunctional DNA-binding transcriptional regulator/O6-methylguanine-DNA methyltransferase Ada [Thermomicrobiales bacterium]|nr:bifunctional DNA-binding transcriptional regulator/O6-methylguanine-DNA methyltransferase Ada [Thermomicrobiales bacterium]
MMQQTLTETEMWQAVEARDRSREGEFWLGVLTTGVFCRPGCPARTPLRKNVVFFDSLSEALRSGLRPCKRCRPLGESVATEQAQMIGTACQHILEADTPPTLTQLAQTAGMSESHFQRLFSDIVGISPAQFARSVREQRLHTQLPMADNVLQAGLEAGYATQSQIYQDAPAALGMTPGNFRNKGKDESIRFTIVDTFLGKTLIAATDKGICRLQFGDDEQTLSDAFKADFANATMLPADDDFTHLVEQTVAALGSPEALNLPLDVRGTAFQIKVWHALRSIPFGKTVSYGDLAKHIGQPTASRAVASACGSNDVAVLIPCHRVIGKDGSLTGYRWGTERKRKILQQEQIG